MRIVWAAPDRSVTPSLNSLVVEPHRTSWLLESGLFEPLILVILWHPQAVIELFAQFAVFCSVWYNGGFSWQEAAFGPHILHTSCSAGVCRAPALRASPEKAPSCQPQNLQALEYFRVEEWMDFSHWFSTPLSYVHGISYTLVPIPQKRMHWMIERQNYSEWTKVKVWELDTDCVHPCVV